MSGRGRRRFGLSGGEGGECSGVEAGGCSEGGGGSVDRDSGSQVILVELAHVAAAAAAVDRSTETAAVGVVESS